MKNLTLVLLTLSLFAAGCGKKNTTNSNGQNSSNSNPVSIGQTGYTPTPGTNLSWDQFKSQVASGSFAAKTGSTEIYSYLGYSVNVSSSDCLWIFTCYSSKTNSTFFSREYSNSYIKHPFCGTSGGTCTSTDPIRQKLTEIITQAQTYGQLSNTRFQIYTFTGYIYVIDVAYPIVANPIARLDSYGSYYELQNVTRL